MPMTEIRPPSDFGSRPRDMGIFNVTVPSGPGIITKAAVSTRLARFAAAAEPSAMVTRHTVALLAVTSATPAGALASSAGSEFHRSGAVGRLPASERLHDVEPSEQSTSQLLQRMMSDVKELPAVGRGRVQLQRG